MKTELEERRMKHMPEEFVRKALMIRLTRCLRIASTTRVSSQENWKAREAKQIFQDYQSLINGNKMKKAYIAFSIHGSNTFIMATKTFTDSDFKIFLNGGFFKQVQSRRRFASDPEDAIKLEWDGLLTKDGNPLRSAPMILSRFHAMVQYGWEINEASYKRFVAKHWKKKK